MKLSDLRNSLGIDKLLSNFETKKIVNEEDWITIHGFEDYPLQSSRTSIGLISFIAKVDSAFDNGALSVVYQDKEERIEGITTTQKNYSVELYIPQDPNDIKIKNTGMSTIHIKRIDIS